MSQKWNFGQIEQGAGVITQNYQTVENLIEQGKQSLARLGNVWGGSGSEAFNGIMSRWNDTSGDLNNKLGRLANNINEAVAAMRQTEASVANRFA